MVLGEKSPNLAMIERLTVGLQTRTADARRPEGPQEPSPGVEPRGPVAPPLLVHTEGVPEGLPAALQAAGDRGRARRTPGFTRGWAPAALQAVRDRPSSCATHLFGLEIVR